MHGQRLPAYQTSSRSGKQAISAWHSSLGIVMGFGGLFCFLFSPKRKRPPYTSEQKQTAPKASFRGRSGRADN